MFEKASRLKLRFSSPVGSLSVEELWDLPLTSKSAQANLDDIAKSLDKKIREQGEKSFVLDAPADGGANSKNQLRFDIVLYIIGVKKAEADAKKLEVSKREQRQKIMALIAEAEDQELRSKGLDELRKALEELQ